MSEWTVRVESTAVNMNDDLADAVIATLSAYAPALSYRPDYVWLTLTVEAETPQQAIQDIAAALNTSGIARTLTRVEAEHAA